MKKVYNIRINDLKKLLKILREHPNDSMVQKDIYVLSNYIKRYERNFTEKRIPLYERLLDDADEIHFYKPFYPFSEAFASIGKSQVELDFDTRYTTFHMSNEQVMNDARKFFKAQGGSFFEAFEDFESEAEDHLKFISTKTDTTGETLLIYSTGEAYVFVPNYSNITKFTILIHESEHVLDFYRRPEFLEINAISEVASVFMELISCDFIAKKYNLYSDSFQRKNFLHALIKSQALLLGDKIELLDLVNKYRGLSEDKLFSILDDRDYSLEDLEYFEEANIRQDNSYQLPYLIAIELYVIYQRNKVKALSILEDIIMNGNQYNILTILDKYGIVLNRNTLYYENCLYKK